jgi:hypothetical protein
MILLQLCNQLAVYFWVTQTCILSVFATALEELVVVSNFSFTSKTETAGSSETLLTTYEAT